MSLYLREDLQQSWQHDAAFVCAETQQGEVFRAREGRRTLRFQLNGRSYFLKYHGGIGWAEIFKNLSQGKLPVLGAMSEVRAIERVADAGLDTLSIAGYGERGSNPARRQSFLVTDDLHNTISLEQVGEFWAGRPPMALKRALLKRVADIARRMHGAGVNHRDFYLCHFLIDREAFDQGNADTPLYLIDLHRSQVRDSVPRRWLIKDLGGLYFSAATWCLSRTDLMRFVACYSGRRPAQQIRAQRHFWAAVVDEAERLYQRHYDKPAAFPLQYSERPDKQT